MLSPLTEILSPFSKLHSICLISSKQKISYTLETVTVWVSPEADSKTRIQVQVVVFGKWFQESLEGLLGSDIGKGKHQ